MKPGDSISRYRIVRTLGRGGMGVVYEAEDTRLERPVALKFLPAESFSTGDRERFLNEARAAGRIRHPNVAPIYDVEEADGRVFISMAYIEGETIVRRLRDGPLGIGEAIAIAIQVARGLEEAHKLGIVHRDIKSGNIMVGPDGHVSILDFGLALMPDTTRITATGVASGTPAYMSPEQVCAQTIDARTDIWSLGVVLFEMLTGKAPFPGGNVVVLARAIASDPAPAVSSLRAGTPPSLDRIVARAIEKQPGKRWQSAREMASALQDAEASLATHATVTLAGLPGVKRPARRLKVAAIAAAVVAMAGGGAWYIGSRSPRATVEAPAPQSTVGPKQVAVLPFQVEGAGAAAVADGLMAVIADAIADPRRAQGNVIAIPVAEIRRREIGTPADARRIYGAELALAGSAEAQGARIRFTLRLVDTATSRELGREVFDYDPAKPQEAKARAVDDVTRLLALKPVPQTAESGAADAYSAYLEGRGLLSRYDLTGNLNKAAASLRRAVGLDPGFALAWTALAEAYWRISRDTADKPVAERALSCARRAVELDPGLAGAHTILGMIHGTAGRQEEAIAELRKALQIAPGSAEAPRELARLYTNLGRFGEAEASYRQAIQARPTDWYAHLLLGLFYIERERYGEAEAALRRAAELAPGNHIAAINLASLYTTVGKYAQAVEVLTRSLQVRQAARTYAALAAVLHYQHKYPEAASAMETGIELEPGRPEYWGNLGIYYKWMPGGEARVKPALERAIELAQKKLAVTPTDYGVRANLAEYRARLGDTRGAMAEIGRIPEAARQSLAGRLAIAYELTGNRRQAIALIGPTLTNPVSLTQIRDDPDLARLWADPLFQEAVKGAFRR